MADLSTIYRSYLDGYKTRNRLLYYTAVSNDKLRFEAPIHDDERWRIMFKCYDAPTGIHRGRDKITSRLIATLLAPPVPLRTTVHSFLRGLSVDEALYFIPCAIIIAAGIGLVLRVQSNELRLRETRRRSQKYGPLVFVDRFSKIAYLDAVPE